MKMLKLNLVNGWRAERHPVQSLSSRPVAPTRLSESDAGSPFFGSKISRGYGGWPP